MHVFALYFCAIVDFCLFMENSSILIQKAGSWCHKYINCVMQRVYNKIQNFTEIQTMPFVQHHRQNGWIPFDLRSIEKKPPRSNEAI